MGGKYREIPGTLGTLGTKVSRGEEVLPFDLVPDDSVLSPTQLLNLTGCRLLFNTEQLHIGVWADLDSPELRAALKGVNLDEYPVVHLDLANVTPEYKVRRCPRRPKSEPMTLWIRRAQALREEQLKCA